MTDELKAKLKELIKSGKIKTDSDLEDFCKEYKADEGEVYQLISEWTAPECCKGCKHIQLYDSMYPCTVCRRGKKDMYSFG
ncbi:MAG: hypothetical protein IJK26_10010 [Clostridia bacterium]|nr:hypothetical protein [Clostridia bacterium]